MRIVIFTDYIEKGSVIGVFEGRNYEEEITYGNEKNFVSLRQRIVAHES